MADGALIETGTDLAPAAERGEGTPRPCVFVPCIAKERIHQGEIITGLYEWIRGGVDESGVPKFDAREQPFAIVMTQDCDLAQDHMERFTPDPDPDRRRPRRLLPSILFCEMSNVPPLIAEAKLRGDAKKQLSQNNSQRFQFLRKVHENDDQFREGLPELGIDFARIFTIQTDEVYRQLEESPLLTEPPVPHARRRCQLYESYREHLQQRFVSFLGRVSLDIDHNAEFDDSGKRIRRGSLHGWLPPIGD